MSDRKAGRKCEPDPTEFVVTLLADIEEGWREGMKQLTAADFIRLTQLGQTLNDKSSLTEIKELRVTWVKTPEESDSER